MQSLIGKLNGWKTYGFAAVLALLAGVDIGGYLPDENKTAIYAAAFAGLAAALRLAISKLPAATQEQIELARRQLNIENKQAKWAYSSARLDYDALVQRMDERLEALQQESLRQHWQPGDPLSEAVSTTTPEPAPASTTTGAVVSGVLLLCLCLPAIASAGDIRIVGPASVPAPGYPCELYIQGDLPEGTEITWDYSPRLEGLPLVESVSEQSGSIARLNTMAGSYRLVVAIAVPGQKPVLRYHNFYVPGTPYVPPAPVPPSPPVPQPQPQPTPIPEPVNPIPPQPADPVFEDGQFGMAAATYRAVMAVNSTNRREEALCLVKRLLFIRNSIQSGSFDSVQTIVNALAQAFNECLPETWNSVRDKLTDRIADLLQARRLTTMQHWQTLADEALLGLTEAGKR